MLALTQNTNENGQIIFLSIRKVEKEATHSLVTPGGISLNLLSILAFRVLSHRTDS